MMYWSRCVLLTAAIACACVCPAEAQVSNRSTSPKIAQREVSAMEKQGWKLTFHDEFDGRRLDTNKWIDSYPDNVRTHGNDEQQYYAPGAYDLRDGCLRLIGQHKESHGHPYTSGMITSYGKFAQQYGWYEIRAKFPPGKGYWPAFWLLPESKAWPPEIDILEILGHEPNKVYLTNHFLNDQHKHEGKGGSFTGPDFSTAFHTFAVDWEPQSITWYVDGVQRFQVTDHSPAQPMYLLANLAIGGDWPGNPDATTKFPGYMTIDYIRVYQHAQPGK